MVDHQVGSRFDCSACLLAFCWVVFVVRPDFVSRPELRLFSERNTDLFRPAEFFRLSVDGDSILVVVSNASLAIRQTNFFPQIIRRDNVLEFNRNGRTKGKGKEG